MATYNTYLFYFIIASQAEWTYYYNIRTQIQDTLSKFTAELTQF